MKKHEHIVKKVQSGSIAEELGIEPGDQLLEIDGNVIEDIFDYQFYVEAEELVVLVEKPDGEQWEMEIEKEADEGLGIEFEEGLMDEYHSCHNKCIFCFIDQMPPGMRETLYFKDDDSRLSFLQGNYITLTNMSDKDVERIVRYRLEPINISFQTTNPELRCKMLHNRFAGEALKKVDILYQGGIEMNGQIVLCKGVNDKDELKRSIEDLMKYLPFMRSVSVVPAGLSKYREGLYPLELFDKEEAEEVIDLIESYQKKAYDEFGLHFIHASDEWYILAERDFPEEGRYDGYIQLENGVGMMRLLRDEFYHAFEELQESEEYPKLKEGIARTFTIATAKLAYPTIQEFADRITEAFPKVKITVACIRNDFFGETITVSGLITGQDLVAQLKERKEAGEDLGDTLQIPINMLRSGEEVFLDDLTVQDVEAALGMTVKAVESGGKDFLDAALNLDYHTERNNENFVYIKAYDREDE
mgnify:CR=1 FL=1